MSTTAIDIPAAAPLATLPINDPVGQMLSAVIKGGVTAENVSAIEKLADLYERMQDKDAERQFAAAFVALQADMPPIQASKPVPNKDGSIRYRFAPYEEIMGTVRPLLQKHGFTVTFSSDVKDGRVTQACTLQHVGGHKRTNQFAARIGSGPPGSSDAQGDGAASTYAKRFALCDALNITIGHDTDGLPPPTDFVTHEQADEIARLVDAARGLADFKEPTFWKWVGVSAAKDIPADRYADVVAMLKRKLKG